MRIATWNINGMNARSEYIGHWLREIQPDLVGFQELKMTDDRFPHEVFEELGYQAVTHGQKSWNGVAVLSKEPVEVVQRGLPGQDELGARLLAVRHGELFFTTVYCPNGKNTKHEDYQRKLAWFDALIEWWKSAAPEDGKGVLCGDFNIVPAPIDSWNEEKLAGKIFHTEAERSVMGRLFELGLVDTWRAQHPDDPGFSWWDYRGGAFHKHQGLRIDLLLATPAAADEVKSATLERRWRKKVEGLTASDHAPVWIDL